MEQKHLEENVKTFLEKHSLKLSELKWHNEGKTKILQLAIMDHKNEMDLDTCTQVAQDISPYLDEWLKDIDNYSLEVCSPGAERELHSADELMSVVGQNVWVRFIHPIEKSLEWTGKLLAFDGVTGSLNVHIKSRSKNINFDYQNIVKIRLAVIL